MTHLARVVEKIGPEFSILKDISITDIKEAGIPLLGEAIERIRSNRLHIQPGYDGEFGKIKIFTEEEKRELSGRKMLFACRKAEADPSFVKAGSRKSKGRIEKKDQSELQFAKDKIATVNPEQQRVIEFPGGPLVVVAGPGTGKTHTLTQRIARLISVDNVLPDAILAITFTVKAAQEMTQRLATLGISGEAKVMTCTFHALGHALLSQWQDTEQSFSILDDQGQRALFDNKLLPEFACDLEQTPQNLIAMIGSAKQKVLGPEDDLSDIIEPFSMDPVRFAEIFASYQAYLRSSRLWDYDDLVSETVLRLERDPVLRETVRKRFPHVFVDEYQDVNHAQYRLVRILCPPGANITVIGDPDQAIYGFRGADSAYFRRFDQDYPGAQSLSLSRNYRSTDTILSGAFQMITKGVENGHRIRISSGKKGSGTITVFENPTERSEATAIGKCIEQLMGGTGFHSHDFQQEALIFEHDLGFSDFGILTRTHAQGRIIAEALEKGGIPCQHVSKEGFWSHPVLTHLLTGLKIIHELPCLRHEIEAFDSIFPKGVEILRCIMGEHKDLANQPLRSQIELLFQKLPGCKEALTGKQIKSCYEQLLAMATPFGSDTADYLKTLYLSRDQDLFDLNAEKVSIMTMHASKGLEFEVVFVAGCEDGLLPYRKPGQVSADEEEERRLFYVAMTRAKSLLFLSYAQKRMRFGKTDATKLSPFVNAINKQLLCFESPKFTRLEHGNKPVQLSLF
jgi:superfamily I DNA/RNA helicase